MVRMFVCFVLIVSLLWYPQASFGWLGYSKYGSPTRTIRTRSRSSRRHITTTATPSTTTAPLFSDAYVSTPWEKPSADLERKFSLLRCAFPSDANIVEAGGWYNLEKLAENPKEELVSLIVDGLKGGNKNDDGETTDSKEGDKKVQFSTSSTSEKLSALLLLLYGMGKGFDADDVDGEWDLVFTRQGTKSPSFQKWVGDKERAGFSKNWFDITTMTFSGLVKFWKYGRVETKVKYEPVVEARSYTSDGKIVLRRIVCTLLNAFIKWWRLPGLPLPLPKKPGYLDVIYLDKDLRITKGNRGGLFVHFRPAYSDKVLFS
jgi:PAP_fibrillin